MSNRRAAAKELKQEYVTVTERKQLEAWVERCFKTGVASIDCETTSVDAMSCNLVGLSLSPEPGLACYVPIAHEGTECLPLDFVVKTINRLTTSPVVAIVGQNIKFDMTVLGRYGIEIIGPQDSMLMSSVMFGGKYRSNFDELCQVHLGHKTVKFSDVAGSGKDQLTFDQVDIEPATYYAAEDADYTLRLAYYFYQLFEREENAAALRLYSELERPLVPVIASMEQAGILVDPEQLTELTDQFAEKRDAALERAERYAGVEFNPGSPEQVAEVLVERLKVPMTERTDTGKIATGVDVLEDVLHEGRLSDDAREVIDAVLEYRKYQKFIGTYTEGLREAINADTGRIHTSYKMASVITGRLACSDPNLQNIPSPDKGPEGKLIRGAFVAPEGHRLIAADYSQIELRIAAHASGSEAMIEAFMSGVDFHAATAAAMAGIPVEDVTKEQRRAAKAINFGIIYGKTSYGLSRDLRISESEAQGIIDDYFAAYPELKDYMERAQQFARKYGYVETMLGRRIHFPDIASPQRSRRGHAERSAINAPIQGTAAEVIKAAMLNVSDALREHKFATRMLLQVHDELVFEAPDEEVDEVMPFIQRIMETAVDYIDVPLVVEIHDGATWAEAK